MTFRATAVDEGVRLDAALAARGVAASRAAAARLVDAGAVRVDGRRRPRSHRLRAGERVEAEVAPDPQPETGKVPF
jgi:23S rRNA pseudouridine1911/1915/1917 synthase